MSYTCTAFCDITGRESRLPLRIRGDGCGPKVQLSFDDLDMGNIFVNSIHTYEVVLANKGDIDAIFSVLPSNTIFGPKFSFNPAEGIVMPDGHQAIQVTFQSPTLGNFKEDFYVQIDGSPHKLCLSFMWVVLTLVLNLFQLTTICLHFLPFLSTEVVQVVKIFYHGRQWSVYPAQSMSWLPMTWWCKEQGHQ